MFDSSAPVHGLVVRGDHPAFAGGDDFVVLQAEGTGIAERTNGVAFVGRAVGLGAIFEDFQIVLLRNLQNRIMSHGVPRM